MILPENDGGNGSSGGVEVPVERMSVERSVWEKTKEKWKGREAESETAKEEIRGSG